MIDRCVACFPANKALIARMRDALGTNTVLQPYSVVAPLVEAIRSGDVSITVVFVDASNYDSQYAVIRRLHAGFASHPLVAYYDARGLPARHLLTLAQSGITDVVHVDLDDSRHVFAKILESAERTTHARIVSDRVAHKLPLGVRSVFGYALEHAGDSLNVDQLAAALGVNRRTLAWRLNQHRLPPPRVFLTWCRLMVAGLLLDERDRTLDSVAEQLTFPSGHSLGAVFFRYLGHGIMNLREKGVADEVICAFLDAIKGTDTSLPPS